MLGKWDDNYIGQALEIEEEGFKIRQKKDIPQRLRIKFFDGPECAARGTNGWSYGKHSWALELGNMFNTSTSKHSLISFVS